MIFADDGIRTADLWNWKRPLYQLSHNHCPKQGIFTEPNNTVPTEKTKIKNKEQQSLKHKMADLSMIIE